MPYIKQHVPICQVSLTLYTVCSPFVNISQKNPTFYTNIVLRCMSVACHGYNVGVPKEKSGYKIIPLMYMATFPNRQHWMVYDGF